MAIMAAVITAVIGDRILIITRIPDMDMGTIMVVERVIARHQDQDLTAKVVWEELPTE
jgi:hypothetical protein